MAKKAIFKKQLHEHKKFGIFHQGKASGEKDLITGAN
jgi:hypothetical protein